RPQRGAEAADAAGQSAVGRQGGGAVAAGEMDGAAVAGRRVVELVLRRDGGAEGRGRGSTARGAHGEVGRGGGADGHGAAGAGDGTCDRVGGGEGLVAGGLERGDEGAVAAGKGAVGRQRGGAICTREVDRARVAGGSVVELIERRHA